MVYLHTPLRKRDTVSPTSLCSIPCIHQLSYSPISPADPLCNTGTTHTISAYWLALTPNYQQTLGSFSSQIKQKFSLLQPCTQIQPQPTHPYSSNTTNKNSWLDITYKSLPSYVPKPIWITNKTLKFNGKTLPL